MRLVLYQPEIAQNARRTITLRDGLVVGRRQPLGMALSHLLAGQTPGKRLMGLTVLSRDGAPPSAGAGPRHLRCPRGAGRRS